MSKSRGTVAPTSDRALGSMHAALEMFIAPSTRVLPADESIPGFTASAAAFRCSGGFRGRGALAPGDGTPEQQRLLARTLQGVTEDIEAMRFNTAISKLMVFVRDVGSPVPAAAARRFALLLSPFAPHLAEELWQRLGGTASLAHEPWPEADPAWLVAETMTLAVQVNGKRRDEITVAADADEETIRQAALGCEAVQRHLGGRVPRKLIVVPGRLVNIVG